VVEARDNGGSGGGAATDQRRANMKEQFQWNSNLKCQRKLVRKTKNINEKHANANEGIRETYNGKKERRCREELKTRVQEQ